MSHVLPKSMQNYCTFSWSSLTVCRIEVDMFCCPDFSISVRESSYVLQ